MNDQNRSTSKPEILAPAGSRASFLAALAAGADAVYCGLKTFSARMEAPNFSIPELASLTRLAHEKGTKVYVALNSLLKPDDINKAGSILDQLNRFVQPDALIIQDLAMVKLAQQIGYSGELHLSTLANISFPSALKLIKTIPKVNRVVIPRELGIDEIKKMAPACPDGIDLEVFIHGALCYAVSGRCYWSSFLGGKSGLRGRCVQPCRRVYKQEEKTRRFFSCLDLSIDVLVKLLLSIPNVRTWKIEGRKKGPHYVFYTVQAYKIFRDHGNDPKMKKTALALLEQALGRKATHYNFLPQRPQKPVNIEEQTGSGLLVGKVQGGRQKPYLIPREKLLTGDVLRLGYEDESRHGIYRVTKYVPKRGRLYLKLSSKGGPQSGAPVFLIDRREEELATLITGLEKELEKIPAVSVPPSRFKAGFPKRFKKRTPLFELHVYRKPHRGKAVGQAGLWLSDDSFNALPKAMVPGCWWWLPPVLWPDDENHLNELIGRVLRRGGRNFVLNAPWQISFFKGSKGLNLWAGPFCNQANGLSLSMMESLGFAGVVVSPELGREDFFTLPQTSPLPLGIVLSGNWPLCISRTLSENLKTDRLFASPKGEASWVRKYGPDYWVYPNWKLDIHMKANELQKAGYRMFVHLYEPLPRQIKLKKRPGMWNWDLGLR